MNRAPYNLEELIRAAIEAEGAISFARFMERALYCPGLGYYERRREIGRAGDFFTSVSVGSLFGELLGRQLADWLREIQGGEGVFQIVEAGAHDGRLARDILSWFSRGEPELLRQIEYWILEPSHRRRDWQREMLADFSDRLHWFKDWQAVSRKADTPVRPATGPVRRATGLPKSVHGVIFSNELLDAFPIRRFGWDATQRQWFEWGVGWEQQRFVWKRMPLDSAGALAGAVSRIPAELLDVLPDGFILEESLGAVEWWQAAAQHLGRGVLMAIDYGLTEPEFLRPERASGTLRAYHQHRLSNDVLACPGEQDLTAHVDFTALQRAGEEFGLITEDLLSQSRFLTRIAGRFWKTSPPTPGEVRQFQTLIHPEHLGRPFSVLIQRKAE